jgi:hypothetical protein
LFDATGWRGERAGVPGVRGNTGANAGPNDLVVLDNLSSHKPQRVADLIRAASADLVYLPPYSPDLNPIELAFSKIKQSLRSLAIRRVDEQWRAMQAVLDQITSGDANGFYRHCGYAAEQN